MRIGLLSDTHGWIHPSVFKHFADCDEIWHAGDIGTSDVANKLSKFKPLRAVYGNIDNAGLRQQFTEDLRFNVEGLDVWITHIGGYPGRYDRRIKDSIYRNPPGLFISGHSHIAKVMHDKRLGTLHINPGSAGFNGFHKFMTIVKFSVNQGKITDLEMIELGERGRIED